MPELPEVETIVRTLAPQIIGRAVTSVCPLYPKVLQSGLELLPLLEAGAGGCLAVSRVFRRAKLLLFLLAPVSPSAVCGAEAELLMIFHLKMTGGLFLHAAGSVPLKHTRLIADFSDGCRLFFDDMRTFGYCRIMRHAALDSWPFWASLGPEPLGMSPRDLAAHFVHVFAGRTVSIKAALLDQRTVAGIGNIYADESLFHAGIHPRAHVSDLGMERLDALTEALQRVLRRAIRERGSSIRNYRDAYGQAGAFQNSFAVYGRKGQPCVSCRRPLAGARIAGRGTVYCPFCQQ
ncbi:MAG: bifunctional DNA-formamidopyrimidine glycosylase/DNA-(apurinic or apyrimidinic site) lyase [Desulfovibrio sp.]|jgi:formamidopyrimidine-DNA glycosylase|nr:bifunctional DNA-formamidopyrimidine glycosylase/DNA-(apurinic or apyrimidinic site) lyase [Desulfovibrio sp.]